MALRLHFHDSTFVAIRDLNTWGLQQSGGSSFPGAATLGIGQIPIFWKGVDRFTNNGNNRRSLKRWIYSLPLQAKDEGGQSMLVPASPTTVFGIYIYFNIYTYPLTHGFTKLDNFYVKTILNTWSTIIETLMGPSGHRFAACLPPGTEGMWRWNSQMAVLIFLIGHSSLSILKIKHPRFAQCADFLNILVVASREKVSEFCCNCYTQPSDVNRHPFSAPSKSFWLPTMKILRGVPYFEKTDDRPISCSSVLILEKP